jgi:ABC-2 type transport system ATP-binding protein
MEIEEMKDRPVRNLSEGIRRRICVAVAFIGRSRVVVLDEPTSGVDPVARYVR